MSTLNKVTCGLRALFQKQQAEQDMDEELRSFVEAAAQEKMRSGMSREDAVRSVRLEMGSIDGVKEGIRSAGWERAVETLGQDVRYGLRQLKRNPGFASLAVLTLALGIGATTAIFTVVNGVLLRPLPYPHPEQLVYVQEVIGKFGVNLFSGNREFEAWRSQTRTLGEIAAYIGADFNLTGGGEPERVEAGIVTASLFTMLGVRPVAGRLFLPEEDRPGAPPVVMLGESLWRLRYAGDSAILGKAITLDGIPYTVVGVVPATLVIPDQGKFDYALWVPLAESRSETAPFRIVRVIGRLRAGVSLDASRSELNTILKSTRAGGPKGWVKGIVLSPWQDQITAQSRLSLLLFLAAVGFLLLIACANVANLLLSRAATRQKEVTVRLTVGAGRPRIVRQLLTESTLLALLGGLLGLLMARWGKDLLVAFISPNLPALEPITLDYRVMAFSLALAVFTGLAFGMFPAFQASGISLMEVLKEAGRSTSESRPGLHFRNLLIIGETALAVVLLVGAGLLFRSFLRVRGIDMGFKSQNILSMTIDLTPSKYPTAKVQGAFFQQVLEKIRGLDGVQAVAGSTCPPLGNRMTTVNTELQAQGQSIEIPDASSTAVSASFFRTLGIPLVQGRLFTEADREGAPSAAIVDQAFARRYCPGGNCLGGRLESWVHQKDQVTIVGVVGNARDAADVDSAPKIYLPFAQASTAYMTVLVRTAGNPQRWAAAVRTQVASVDKDQPPHDVMTLKELRSKSLTPRRVNMLLVGAFAALGLILASVGIYGVVSYSVSQRTHEIGVRMAMGAERGEVLRIVIAQGLLPVAIGAAAGLAASLALTRFLQTMLFDVKPTDLGTFLAVSVILVCVALLATCVPALRATKVDPMVALRYE